MLTSKFYQPTGWLSTCRAWLLESNMGVKLRIVEFVPSPELIKVTRIETFWHAKDYYKAIFSSPDVVRNYVRELATDGNLADLFMQDKISALPAVVIVIYREQLNDA